MSDAGIDAEAAGIYARRIDPLDTVCQLGIAGAKVVGVSFPDELPADAGTDHEYLDRLEEYAAGEEGRIADIPVALTVPTDYRAVLEALRSVPPGRTITTEQLARMADLDPDEQGTERTVRDALRENPAPIFVPDHRVRDARGATPSSIAAALRRLEG